MLVSLTVTRGWLTNKCVSRTQNTGRRQHSAWRFCHGPPFGNCSPHISQAQQVPVPERAGPGFLFLLEMWRAGQPWHLPREPFPKTYMK